MLNGRIVRLLGTQKFGEFVHTITSATGTNGQRQLTNFESVQLLLKHIVRNLIGCIPLLPLSPSARMRNFRETGFVSALWTGSVCELSCCSRSAGGASDISRMVGRIL